MASKHMERTLDLISQEESINAARHAPVTKVKKTGTRQCRQGRGTSTLENSGFLSE